MENTLQLFSLMTKAIQGSQPTEKKVVNQPIEDDKTKVKEIPNISENKPRSASSISKVLKNNDEVLGSEINFKLTKETQSSKLRRENSSVEGGETDLKQTQDPLCQLADFIGNALDNGFEVNTLSQSYKCCEVFDTFDWGL